MRLAELMPGIPDKEHAAQLHTEEFVDDHILEWLLDPEVVTLPFSEWPDYHLGRGSIARSSRTGTR